MAGRRDATSSSPGAAGNSYDGHLGSYTLGERTVLNGMREEAAAAAAAATTTRTTAGHSSDDEIYEVPGKAQTPSTSSPEGRSSTMKGLRQRIQHERQQLLELEIQLHSRRQRHLLSSSPPSTANSSLERKPLSPSRPAHFSTPDDPLTSSHLRSASPPLSTTPHRGGGSQKTTGPWRESAPASAYHSSPSPPLPSTAAAYATHEDEDVDEGTGVGVGVGVGVGEVGSKEASTIASVLSAVRDVKALILSLEKDQAEDRGKVRGLTEQITSMQQALRILASEGVTNVQGFDEGLAQARAEAGVMQCEISGIKLRMESAMERIGRLEALVVEQNATTDELSIDGARERGGGGGGGAGERGEYDYDASPSQIRFINGLSRAGQYTSAGESAQTSAQETRPNLVEEWRFAATEQRNVGETPSLHAARAEGMPSPAQRLVMATPDDGLVTLKASHVKWAAFIAGCAFSYASFKR